MIQNRECIILINRPFVYVFIFVRRGHAYYGFLEENFGFCVFLAIRPSDSFHWFAYDVFLVVQH